MMIAICGFFQHYNLYKIINSPYKANFFEHKPSIIVNKDITINALMNNSMLPKLLMNIMVSYPSSSKFEGISTSFSENLYIAWFIVSTGRISKFAMSIRYP